MCSDYKAKLYSVNYMKIIVKKTSFQSYIQSFEKSHVDFKKVSVTKPHFSKSVLICHEPLQYKFSILTPLTLHGLIKMFSLHIFTYSTDKFHAMQRKCLNTHLFHILSLHSATAFTSPFLDKLA